MPAFTPTLLAPILPELPPELSTAPAIDLSIVIVNWNTRDLLAQCLTSLAANTLMPASLNVETFVVDNASIDGSVPMVRESFPWITLIENQSNVGFAPANNQGIVLTRGRYVLLLNSDAIVGQQALARLLTFADAHPRAGIVGVKLVNSDATFQAAANDFPTLASTLAEPWGLMHVLTHNPYYPSYPPARSERSTTCDWVGGACLLARRQAIRDVGLLDPSFFMNSEEVDWCYRMRRHGWEVWYTPGVEVVHLGGGSADRRSAAQRMRSFEGKVRFLTKHHGSLAGRLAHLNFRLSSLAKAAWYQARFVFSGDVRQRTVAHAYWEVATKVHWV